MLKKLSINWRELNFDTSWQFPLIKDIIWRVEKSRERKKERVKALPDLEKRESDLLSPRFRIQIDLSQSKISQSSRFWLLCSGEQILIAPTPRFRSFCHWVGAPREISLRDQSSRSWYLCPRDGSPRVQRMITLCQGFRSLCSRNGSPRFRSLYPNGQRMIAMCPRLRPLCPRESCPRVPDLDLAALEKKLQLMTV